MNIAKVAVLAVFFLVVAGAGFYFTATRIPVENIDVEQLQATLPSGHVQQVLGESIQITGESNDPKATSIQSGTPLVGVNQDQKPLHERALDHGLYLYCKGIVEEYETSN